jgi:hypothetical protein
MLFKYFIKFNDHGKIDNVYETKEECKDCKEYLVKLIPIERDDAELLKSNLDSLNKFVDDFIYKGKKFETELNKTIKNLKRRI